MKTLLATILIFAGVIAGSMSPAYSLGGKDKSSTSTMEKAVEKQTTQSHRVVPLPAITNFTVRKNLKWIYELQDNPDFQTFTYYFSEMTGELGANVCGGPYGTGESIGIPINASIQFSNPVRRAFPVTRNGRIHMGQTSDLLMPQPEPNGLWMPEGLASSYVICKFKDPRTEKLFPFPVYIEANVQTFPVPMKDFDIK